MRLELQNENTAYFYSQIGNHYHLFLVLLTSVAAKYRLKSMVTSNVRAYLKAIGRKGGKERARKLNFSTLSSQARNAAQSRWMLKRFGVGHFQALALPGSEIVDSGLRDLIQGDFSSVSALAVSELRPKLRFLGVPVPKLPDQIVHPRALLYQALEAQEGDMAYVRFCALLERLDSFCDSLASIIPTPKQSVHRQRRWYA